MKKQDLVDITNSYYRKIKKQAGIIGKEYDAEAIHQFRVEYKKLRAFLRMLSGETMPGKIKLAKSLEKTYAVTGAMRDLQLQAQKISAITGNKSPKQQAYLLLLQKKIDELKPELADLLSHKPVAESKRKTLALLPDEFSLNPFQQYVRKSRASIFDIISHGNYSDDNIHHIRKIIKDLFYNLKNYEGLEYQKLLVTTWKGKDEATIQKLMEDLGVFQDRCISISLLKSYWLDSFSAIHRKWLEYLKKEWIKEKIKEKKGLIEKIRALFIPLKKEVPIKHPSNPYV